MWARRGNRMLHWLLGRYRSFLEIVGYPYPPVYLLIADLGVLCVCLFALAQRIVEGFSGSQTLVLAAAVIVGIEPVFSLFVKAEWHQMPLLPVKLAGTVVLFWLVPVPGDVAPLLLAIGATMSAAATPPRGTAAHTVVYLATAIGGAIWHGSPQGWLYILMVGFAAWVGVLLKIQLQLLETERREQAQQLALDRAAIAGEVHDVVAHSLSIVLLNVTAARRVLQEDADDVGDAVDALRDAERQGRVAMDDVRRTIELLRSDGAPVRAQPGLADLDALVDGFRRAGSTVAFTSRAPATALTSATELAVFRVVQESLSNAARHAAGQPVTVDVGPGESGTYVVRVRNPLAAGGGRRGRGYGLAGMASRVTNTGGRLRAGMVDDRWCVTACFDLAQVVGPGGC
ncbi:MAG: histidine kinase [Gordonia sp. (in: high G+C Gram-positive bacteria)]